MKWFKRLLFALVGFIVLLLLTAHFVKNEYTVEQAIAINQPKELVFRYVKFVCNQERFNTWILNDPQVQKQYRGEDGTPGFVYAWESRGSAGKGEQEIRNIREGEQVDLSLHFIKPFESRAAAYLKTEALDANSTRLTWHMEDRNPYPLNILNLFVPSLLENNLAESLQTTKTILEKQ